MIPAATYSSNTYIGTVGANGNFAAQVALRVGSSSNPNITDDAQIRKVAAPQVIEIRNLTTEPKIGQWINAKTSVALSAKVTSKLADAKHVFVANTANADVSAAILTLNGTGDAFSGTLTPAMLANLSNDGTLYLCAQNKNGTTETARASVAFKVLRDVYSPRMSNVSAQSMQDGTVNVSLEATDTQSGVKTVFASAASTNPPDTGRTPLTYDQNTKKWSTAFTGGVWYLYAVDNAGNVSAVPEKIETAVGDIIPIYSYADLTKIGVAKGYPLSGKYIQMNDFKIPDGTTHTPIGDANVAFSGMYNGNGFTITGGKNMTWKSVVTGGWQDGSGLFGLVVDGTVKNMTLNDITASVTGSTTYVYAGAVAAFADRATFERINVNNVNLTVAVTNVGIVMGGAFGATLGGSITANCAVNGSITGTMNRTSPSNSLTHIGGLTGYNGNSKIKNSVANVEVTDSADQYIYTGGFVG
ncbi:MAG: hypothetical protein RR351_04290, partial [Christensenella sp.]